MKKFSKSLIAIGLVSAVAGCAPGSNPENMEKIPSTPAKEASGKEALSGCDLDEARQELRKRIVDGKPFWAKVLSDKTGQKLTYTAEDNRFGIANPLILMCGEKVVAYAGQTHGLKAKKGNAYNPIALIRPGHRNSKDLFVGRADTGKLEVRTTKLHFDREELQEAAATIRTDRVATYFEDSQGGIYGSALDIDFMRALESALQPPPPPVPSPGQERSQI